jgi:hypothetical protein
MSEESRGRRRFVVRRVLARTAFAASGLVALAGIFALSVGAHLSSGCTSVAIHAPELPVGAMVRQACVDGSCVDFGGRLIPTDEFGEWSDAPEAVVTVTYSLRDAARISYEGVAATEVVVLNGDGPFKWVRCRLVGGRVTDAGVIEPWSST